MAKDNELLSFTDDEPRKYYRTGIMIPRANDLKLDTDELRDQHNYPTPGAVELHAVLESFLAFTRAVLKTGFPPWEDLQYEAKKYAEAIAFQAWCGDAHNKCIDFDKDRNCGNKSCGPCNPEGRWENREGNDDWEEGE